MIVKKVIIKKEEMIHHLHHHLMLDLDLDPKVKIIIIVINLNLAKNKKTVHHLGVVLDLD